MNATLIELAKRVKRGARLLDKKVPGWRKIMRQNADSFDIANGECCILGTLEHAEGLAKINARKAARLNRNYANGFEVGALRLGLLTEDDDNPRYAGKTAADYGFNQSSQLDRYKRAGISMDDGIGQFALLNDLWKAEFSE